MNQSKEMKTLIDFFDLKKQLNMNTAFQPMLSLLLILCGLFFPSPAQGQAPPTKAEIKMTDEGYRIFLDGKPFYVEGAGVERGNLKVLAAHGANSLRTWSTDDGMRTGEETLDEAYELGLKVNMGLWVVPERHGFDYNDTAAIAQQLERMRQKVIWLKDHPALIIWGIGNELNLNSKNPRVWDAVNEISKMIHELDPNHLTTTALAGLSKKDLEEIQKRAPDLDFICVQLYKDIESLPQQIARSGYKGPLMVTEWGATGYWEVPKTTWGAPIENNSSVKAALYTSRYHKSILSQKQQVMGSFVFLWGQKQERTPTWFGMFLPDGKETEAVDVMHYEWKGEWPENRTPRLHDFSLGGKRALDNIKLEPGKKYSARVKVSDPDKDELVYHWEIKEESKSTATGGDREKIPETISKAFIKRPGKKARFIAPEQKGAYRLFIYVYDGKEHAAHANIPFLVE